MILWWKNSKPPHRPRDCRQIIVSYDNWEIVISIFYSSTRAGRWRRKRKNEFIWRVDYKYIEVNECTAPSLARQPLTKPWARMYSYETNFAMNFSSCLLAFVIHKKSVIMDYCASTYPASAAQSCSSIWGPPAWSEQSQPPTHLTQETNTVGTGKVT